MVKSKLRKPQTLGATPPRQVAARHCSVWLFNRGLFGFTTNILPTNSLSSFQPVDNFIIVDFLQSLAFKTVSRQFEQKISPGLNDSLKPANSLYCGLFGFTTVHKIPLDPVQPVDNFIIVDFLQSLTFKTDSRQFEQKKFFRAQRQDYCQPTVRSSNNHPDKGSLRPTQVCSNGGVRCIRNFLSSFNIWCRGQDAVSKTRHCFKPKRWAQAADSKKRYD